MANNNNNNNHDTLEGLFRQVHGDDAQVVWQVHFNEDGTVNQLTQVTKKARTEEDCRKNIVDWKAKEGRLKTELQFLLEGLRNGLNPEFVDRMLDMVWVAGPNGTAIHPPPAVRAQVCPEQLNTLLQNMVKARMADIKEARQQIKLNKELLRQLEQATWAKNQFNNFKGDPDNDNNSGGSGIAA